MSLYSSSPIRLALVRALSVSFKEALQQHPSASPIDVSKAHFQHEAYTKVLSQRVKNVVQIAGDESFPDCCFIEDTAIVIDNIAIITRIGADSRRGESKAVAEALSRLDKDDFPLEIHNLEDPASLDGGDVLQMNGYLFVGISKRSNVNAVEQLQAILPGRVFPVTVEGGLHLKSVLSAINDTTLLLADTPQAHAMANSILDKLPKNIEARKVTVPDVVAANVIRLGSHLLIQAGYPQSEAVLHRLAKELSLEIISLDMSELVKADGALTCCSILIP